MDDGGRHENGRQKPTQGQWFMQHQPSMKHIIGVMAERDAAIQERNLAISEKKAALAERDIAILQRDSAIADRNKAMAERDDATTTILYCQNTINNSTMSHCPPVCQIPQGVKHVHHLQHHVQHQTHVAEDPYDAKDVQMVDTILVSSKQAKSGPAKKRAKEASKYAKKIKLEAEDLDENTADLQERKNAHDTMGAPKPEWKNQDLGLNQVVFDETTMPAPVCSCTGVLRQCYKWGYGGWQSSCCTTSLSVYPLPAVPNRRHARVAGRKMTGSAYNKLLSRLAGEGYDLSNPVDLKDNWAKHGTNRYITIK